MLDSDGAGVSEVRVGPDFRIAGKLARRGSPVHATDHCVALLYVKIVADPFVAA
ncbi:hypothetical protein AB0I52_10000 [Streptomyces sp. NPDC050423]|uniref:hypothetical protein n=1 Tax=Streptomyces sp. NPDC050423 TaxID=3155402 RepID=UPI003418CBE0